jgi:acyl carrier protein
LRYLPPSGGLPADAPLRELGLDSMEAAILVLDLEKELGMTLPDSSLTAETFASLANLWMEVGKSMSDRSHPTRSE